jgi:hypothetical protein
MRLVVILGILLNCALVYSQNLQFSQVKLVSSVETVPAGKVWKMDNFLPNTPLVQDLNRGYPNAIAGATKNFVILVNGNSIYLQSQLSREVGRSDGYWNQDGYATSSQHSIFDQPIWFPAGTTVAASTNIQYISIIEFNLVP